jgi:hypothetical protein
MGHELPPGHHADVEKRSVGVNEVKEGFELVVKALGELHQRLTGIESELRGIRVAVVERTKDQDGRIERVEQELASSSRRIAEVEAAVLKLRKSRTA